MEGLFYSFVAPRNYCDILETNPCKNNHVCTSESNETSKNKSYSCNCKKGFSGQNCTKCK